MYKDAMYWSMQFNENGKHIIQLANGVTPQEIRNSRRYYPWFANCIGVIDGTHVVASVPLGIQGRFRGRKGYPTQNVLAGGGCFYVFSQHIVQILVDSSLHEQLFTCYVII
ncbi:unnamed protein product [Coffea canephora]|uniref:DDE Tnp4 domain-containing protein n=1 Tax=Coffea canephora TaxID=49390 RepID=A0A068VEB5_COFCA|nr:unnamed protein product [Coffea canephora]